MLDLLCLGTISVDLYYKGQSLTETENRFELAIGGKYDVEHFYEGLGGGGVNVAIGVSKLGLSSGLMATIGNNPFKPLIHKKLDETTVHYKDYCDSENDYINISSILLNSKGEKTIINYRTPQQHLLNSENDLEKLNHAHAVYIANLAKVSLTQRLKMLHYAKKQNKLIIANLNVTDCRRPLEELIHLIRPMDIIILNGFEFADMVKVPYSAIDFHSNVVSKYAPFNHDDMLVITDGSKGSYAYYQNHVYHKPALKVKEVVDTTGAGDGYSAGFIASFIKNKNVDLAMEKGSEYATIILEKIGAN